MELIINNTIKRVMFCYLFFNSFALIRGFRDSDPFSEIVKLDPYSKQSKLLVSNNYNELMTIYDPVWLAKLWPKLRNGVHLHLQDVCWSNLTLFFQDMMDGRAWALNTIDSTGTYSSGLLWGNRYWIGSQDECNDLNNRYSDLKNNGTSNMLGHMKYVSLLSNNEKSTDSKQSRRDLINPEVLTNMILLDNTPPFPMSFSGITFYLNITKTTLYSSHVIVMGVCLPRSCRSKDIHELVDFSIKTYQNLRVAGTLPRSAKVLNVRSIRQDYNITNDTKFIIICSLMFFLMLLIVIGTLFDRNTQNVENYSESDIPTFKSFIQMESVDNQCIEQSTESKGNATVDAEKTTQAVHLTQITDQNSLETYLTGIIPNKYSEVVSGFNFSENAPDKNKNRMNLVTIKKIVKNNNSPTITLDIISLNSSGNKYKENIEQKMCSTKKKYVISSDKTSDIVLCCQNFFSGKYFESHSCFHKNSLFAKTLGCFSLKFNFNKIFSMDIGEDTLAPVHGIKVIVILWIILVHTCLIVFQLSDNKVYGGNNENNFLYRMIKNGSYSIDTLFVISGVIISYLFCQTLKKYSVTRSGDVIGSFGKIIQFITILFYRYIRLTLPYLVALGVYEILSKYFHSHYIMELQDLDYNNCENHWWRNALYINNLYPLVENCMSQSMYLAVDSQFFIIGIVLLMIGVKHIRTAVLFYITFLLIGWTTTALLTIKSTYTTSIDDTYSSYDELYNKPWTRIGPYLVGLSTGWILCRTNCCLLISKRVSVFLWIVSVASLLSILCGLIGNQLGAYVSIAYATLSHTVWSMAISWILIACVTGYGGFVNTFLSCRYLYPLSRLCFCAYLLHPILLKAVFISSGSVLHVSLETMIVLFLGFLCITFLLALPFSLTFESPAVSLLRLVQQRHENY